ncbi:hypothetical protein FOS39_01665, partial [Lactobacillus paracasei]|nr:hypothetical protein [Lacticaseibacillus paracasei]
MSTEAGGAQRRLKTSIKAVLSLGDAFYELRKIKHIGSSSSRVDRSFVKHLGLNWSRCFYYAAALLLLALNQTRSRNIRL